VTLSCHAFQKLNLPGMVDVVTGNSLKEVDKAFLPARECVRQKLIIKVGDDGPQPLMLFLKKPAIITPGCQGP